jgi:hypothetical protein
MLIKKCCQLSHLLHEYKKLGYYLEVQFVLLQKIGYGPSRKGAAPIWLGRMRGPDFPSRLLTVLRVSGPRAMRRARQD